MEEMVFRTLLLDYYGEILTEKQRLCCDLHDNQDLSLREIGEQLGISHQAVWDIIRRAEQTMEELEDKIHLVARAVKRRQQVEELIFLVQEFMADSREKERILMVLRELAV